MAVAQQTKGNVNALTRQITIFDICYKGLLVLGAQRQNRCTMVCCLYPTFTSFLLSQMNQLVEWDNCAFSILARHYTYHHSASSLGIHRTIRTPQFVKNVYFNRAGSRMEKRHEETGF
jgi:hypothetical protein